MSLKFMDGFGHVSGTPGAFTGERLHNWIAWSGSLSPTFTLYESVNDGVHNYATGAAGVGLTSRDLGMSNTFVVGFRLWMTASTHLIMGLYAIGGIQICNIGVFGGKLVVTITDNFGGGGGIAHTSTASLPTSEWVYCELKIVSHNSAGSVEMRINGAADSSASSLDTSMNATDLNRLFIMADTSFVDWNSATRITDIYVDDADFQGPVGVFYEPMDAAGSEAAFTPLASTNQSQVDELTLDSDTTYNESSTPGDRDALTYSNSLTQAPKAIQPVVFGKVLNGVGRLKVGVRSGATHDQDASVGLIDQYDSVAGKIYQTDPNTAAAWTAANADAAEVTYENAAA